MSDLLATFSGIFSAESVQKGLSRLAEGETVAAETVTLVDDPFHPENPSPRNFDAEGCPTAKKNIIEVALKGTSIPHEIIGEFGAGRVLLKPAAPGTGIIAGGTMRSVLEVAGIRDIRGKSLRSNNPTNVVKATFEALKALRTAEEVAAIRGKTVEEILK